jgi:hypothetical protein
MPRSAWIKQLLNLPGVWQSRAQVRQALTKIEIGRILFDIIGPATRRPAVAHKVEHVCEVMRDCVLGGYCAARSVL